MPQIKIRINLNKFGEVEATYDTLEEALDNVELLAALIKKIQEQSSIVQPKAEKFEVAAPEVKKAKDLEGIVEYDDVGLPHLILGKGEISVKDAVLLTLYAAKEAGISVLTIKEIGEAIPWRVPYSTLAPTVSKLKSKGFLIHLKTSEGKAGYTITKKGLEVVTEILDKLKKRE